MFEYIKDKVRELGETTKYTYQYIKSIAYDVAQSKYGTSREGYEQFKKDFPDFQISFSGVHSLREVTYKNDIVGYIIETKETQSEKFKELNFEFKKAKDILYRELNVVDTESFDTFIDMRLNGYTDKCIYSDSVYKRIMVLEDILYEYYDSEDFKNFIDKIKQ